MGALRVPTVVRALLAALGLWVIALEVSAIVPSHPMTDTLFNEWVIEAVQLVAAGLCAAGAMRHQGRMRRAWLLIAAAIAVWTLGDIYWVALLETRDSVPVPSPADALYLLYPALVLAGLAAMVGDRVTHLRRIVVVDAVIVALAAATISAAFVIEPVAKHATGGTLSVVTNVAYPITDLMLLTVILGAIGLRGWRLDRTWILLGAGTLAFLVADSLYLVAAANGTYSVPSPIDAGWPASMILFAAAAWLPARPHSVPRRVNATRDIMVPVGLAFTALVVATIQRVDTEHLATLAFVSGCVAAVMARLVLTFRENLELIELSRAEALTDDLTGLRNRRALAADLEERLRTAHDGAPLILALFDLDGFKRYNDSYGHPAGDALLARLGANLERCLLGRGTTYRVGGDEFCALIDPRGEIAQPVLEAAAHALGEQGEGFDIGCTYGAVTLPREAGDATEALRLADQRMYGSKPQGRQWAGAQITDVLWRALYERDTILGSHVEDVSALAESVARRLGLSSENVDSVRSAARLHDIGKVAIPDAILHKPGPLEEHEWRFIRDHTVIGERILASAPALSAVAPLVRSSHEHFDGNGYPDQLAGTAIPLGARIVTVCDAFDAMTSDRSYRPAMSTAAALAELRRCAGTQFDPVVVDAFCEEWAQAAQRLAGSVM